MLTSICRYRISSLVNCLMKYFNDRELSDSLTFLILASEGEDLEFFSPGKGYVAYYGKLENVEGKCDKYIGLMSSYNRKTILDTSIKLWNYYIGKSVIFNEKEKGLLSELGIKT